MTQMNTSLEYKFDKRDINSITFFAMNNLADVDEFTLKKFLELVNTTGSFGPITGEQLARIMGWMIQNLPQTCVYSLLKVVELLAACLPVASTSADELANLLAKEQNLVDQPSGRATTRSIVAR